MAALTEYKSLTVARGLTYAYQYRAPAPDKPTLLLLHGFPSTSKDWRPQIEYFAARGYGIVAPDLLGAGRTARPTALADWRLNLMAQDLANVLDDAGAPVVIGVGHDWGCVALSRLFVLHPDRFRAFVWLGHPYIQPITQTFDLPAMMALMKEYLGYEGYSYWEFFARPDAASVIETHNFNRFNMDMVVAESFIQLLYPKDAADWLTYMALPNKTSEWIDGNMQPGYASYLAPGDIAQLRENIAAGIESSLNWYRAQLANADLADNEKIPAEKHNLTKPSFFAVALRDCICTPKWGNQQMLTYGTNAGQHVTTVEYDTGHWVQLEAADKVNADVEKWIEELPREVYE